MSHKILITGGSRGIGAAIALKLSSHEVFAPGSKELDVTSDESVESFFSKNFKKDSELYALVCNAGVFYSASIEKHSLADWQRVIEVNLTGCFRVIKAALPYLRNAKTAHIVLISSVSAEGEAYAPAYTASKAGVNGLARALAYELGSDGINVNAIAPGWVRTDMAKAILHTEKLEKDNLEASLQKRWIEPEEIASLVDYLISPAAKAITGQVLTIDGGL